MDFVIGGVAGAGATIFTNPIDVVKIRMQLQGELTARNHSTARYRGPFHALYVIAKHDGLFALQKGLVPAILFTLTMNSVRLGSYHMCESNGWTKDKNGDIKLLNAAACSCVGGAVSGVTGNPASVVKTRIQAASHPSIAVGRQHRYKGTKDAFVSIYRTEGILGFFQGVNAGLLRAGVGSGAQLTTFSTAKEMILKYKVCGEDSPFLLAFAASAFSGVAIAVAMCPFDVIAVRLYNQGSDKSARLYNGVVDCLQKIYRTEGVHGFYKGLTPMYLRLAPQTTLSLVLWDMLNNLFNNKFR